MKYAGINKNDFAAAPGVSVTFFTQGCPHRCKGCHNPETWDFNGGQEFTDKDKDNILYLLDKNGMKRDFSILGGEPLCEENLKGVINICKYIKKNRPETKIYLWTGYALEEMTKLQLEVLQYIDIIVDGKFEIENKKLGLKMKGSTNQRVIDVNKTIKNRKIVLFE